MGTIQENETDELAQQIGQTAEQFRMRAAAEKDYRAATFYVALEQLRIRWEAGAWAAERIETGTGDRR